MLPLMVTVYPEKTVGHVVDLALVGDVCGTSFSTVILLKFFYGEFAFRSFQKVHHAAWFSALGYFRFKEV
jgi:hypothetical protein